MLDLAKAYDHITYRLLWKNAITYSFDLDVLAFLI